MVAPNVSAADVLAFLGKNAGGLSGPPAEDQINAHIGSVAMMVYSYTRGRGFTEEGPRPDIRQVIISATARSVDNPTHMIKATVGQVAYTPGQFEGFTLPELKVLNGYRVMSA